MSSVLILVLKLSELPAPVLILENAIGFVAKALHNFNEFDEVVANFSWQERETLCICQKHHTLWSHRSQFKTIYTVKSINQCNFVDVRGVQMIYCSWVLLVDGLILVSYALLTSGQILWMVHWRFLRQKDRYRLAECECRGTLATDK